MSTNILGNPETLRKFWRGPHTDLMIKLTGENGPEYEGELNRFLRKQPCWEKIQHVIDCDADPFVPNQFVVDEHVKQGRRVWNADAIRLYHPEKLPEPKKGRKFPTIVQMIELLRGRPTCNTNALDYLLQYPYLIPEEWKKYGIFFFGTVLRFKDQDILYQRWDIRYLQWHGVNWEWDQLSDCNEFGGDYCCGPYRIAEWVNHTRKIEADCSPFSGNFGH
jgi:hypothetical protein